MNDEHIRHDDTVREENPKAEATSEIKQANEEQLSDEDLRNAAGGGILVVDA